MAWGPEPLDPSPYRASQNRTTLNGQKIALGLGLPERKNSQVKLEGQERRARPESPKYSERRTQNFKLRILPVSPVSRFAPSARVMQTGWDHLPSYPETAWHDRGL